MSACPTCDREGTNCPTWDTLIRGTLPNSEVRHIALAAMRDCNANRVDWRAEALTLRARCRAAEAARDEATRRLAALEAADATEADALRVAVEDNLPVYALSEDDDDTANHAERIEYAGDEIKSLTRRLAVVEEAVRVARKSIGVLVDHFEAMGGEEDSSQLAYDLQAISDGLRAALEKQP